MANLGKILKDEIRRITGRHNRASVTPLSREVRAMKRTLREQAKLVDILDRAVKRLLTQAEIRISEVRVGALGEQAETARLRPASIKRIRLKLGMSRHQFAKLCAVTANAIYLWEVGKTVPRAKAKAALLELRKMGKREASRRLAVRAAMPEKPTKVYAKRRRRGGRAKAARATASRRS